MPRVTVELAADIGAAVGEGLFWDAAEQALFAADILAGRLLRIDPSTRRWTELTFDEPLGCLALDSAGRAVGAFRSGFHRIDRATGRREAMAAPEADRPGNRPNDGSVDRQGRFWLGTMKLAGPPEPTGAFYRLDADGGPARVLDGFYTTNGLAFSPDGRTMYFSDSHPDIRTIWACDYDGETGAPSNRRPFFDTRAVAGRPDGATVDAEGCYWMAGVGGWQIVRLTPGGTVDRIVDVPVERPSRPAFGGRGLDTLYCTTLNVALTPGTEDRQPWSGGVIAVTGLGVTGLAQPRFAG